MRGRTRTGWWGVVLAARDAVALASFYSSVLGWPIAKQDGGGAAIAVPGTSSYLAFESAPDYVPPVWPAAGGHQQMMMHIDVAVDDLEAAVAEAVELGATVAGYQPQDDVRVLLDPAGHPFCLYFDHDLD
ncbi:MAG: VOC family protein [Streptosporangiaceae bacterium]